MYIIIYVFFQHILLYHTSVKILHCIIVNFSWSTHVWSIQYVTRRVINSLERLVMLVTQVNTLMIGPEL